MGVHILVIGGWDASMCHIDALPCIIYDLQTNKHKKGEKNTALLF